MAQKLRELRQLAGKVREAAERLCTEIAGIECGHDYEPETCPICALYSLITDADDKSGQFCIDMDQYLLDGPVPTAREVKRG